MHGERSNGRAGRVDRLDHGHEEAVGTLSHQVTEKIFEEGADLCLFSCLCTEIQRSLCLVGAGDWKKNRGSAEREIIFKRKTKLRHWQ